MAAEEQNQTVIAALQREREGYVARGLDDRVAQVDAELARLGVRAPDGPRRRRASSGGETAAVQPETRG